MRREIYGYSLYDESKNIIAWSNVVCRPIQNVTDYCWCRHALQSSSGTLLGGYLFDRCKTKHFVLTIYCHQSETVLQNSGKLDFLRTLMQTETDFWTQSFHIALEIFSSILYSIYSRLFVLDIAVLLHLLCFNSYYDIAHLIQPIGCNINICVCMYVCILLHRFVCLLVLFWLTRIC